MQTHSRLQHPLLAWCTNTRCRGPAIMPEHLPPKMAQSAAHTAAPTRDDDRLSQVERATILATLDECGGNRTQAARKLGISRRALIYKLRAMESPSG